MNGAKQENQSPASDSTSQYKARGPIQPPVEVPKGLTEEVRKPRYAVFVAHGMGQQISFQTLDEVVRGLKEEDDKHRSRLEKSGTPCPTPKPLTTATFQHGEERLHRVQMWLCDSQGQDREVHVYEGYWAPLVEGAVKIRDVLGFFARTFANGIRNGGGRFRRWIFGEYHKFKPTDGTRFNLFIGLLLLLSLIVLNSTLVTVVGARATLGKDHSWLSDNLFADLTTLFNIALTGMLFLVFPIMAAVGLKDLVAAKSPLRRITTLLGWLGFATTLATIIISGLAVPWVFYLYTVQNIPGPLTGWAVSFNVGLQIFWWIVVGSFLIYGLFRFFRQGSKSKRDSNRSGSLPLVLSVAGFAILVLCWIMAPRIQSGYSLWQGITWPLLFVASLAIRNVLVQYPGDVAVYISPHVLDRFNDLRKKIRDCVYRQAEGVYALKIGGEWAYDGVFIVGHSLGSVVVYDVLNRLIVQDEMALSSAYTVKTSGQSEHLGILERTKLLLTFGSPLDKTAFLFALQGNKTSETREAVAAEIQPLIKDPGFRTFPWINIHSSQDIFSGKLNYYNFTKTKFPVAIKNVKDPDATTVLLAHTEYWKNFTLFHMLHEKLTASGSSQTSTLSPASGVSNLPSETPAATA